jgi:hypothetical protein
MNPIASGKLYTMRFFLDTEFSDLSDNAELISLGAIAESGESFYLEVAPLPSPISDFVKAEVVPHLEGGALAVSLRDLEARFIEWLSRWPTATLVMDSDWDILILRRTFTGENSRAPGPLRFRPHGREILTIDLCQGTTYEGDGLVKYFDTLYKMEREPGFRKHHALDDAKAMRAAIIAAEAVARAKGTV